MSWFPFFSITKTLTKKLYTYICISIRYILKSVTIESKNINILYFNKYFEVALLKYGISLYASSAQSIGKDFDLLLA